MERLYRVASTISEQCTNFPLQPIKEARGRRRSYFHLAGRMGPCHRADCSSTKMAIFTGPQMAEGLCRPVLYSSLLRLPSEAYHGVRVCSITSPAVAMGVIPWLESLSTIKADFGEPPLPEEAVLFLEESYFDSTLPRTRVIFGQRPSSTPSVDLMAFALWHGWCAGITHSTEPRRRAGLTEPVLSL